jgi:hypothetical protein
MMFTRHIKPECSRLFLLCVAMMCYILICLLFSAIAESGSKIFQVDYENLQTNILMIYINSQQITSKEFCDRLAMVR